MRALALILHLFGSPDLGTADRLSLVPELALSMESALPDLTAPKTANPLPDFAPQRGREIGGALAGSLLANTLAIGVGYAAYSATEDEGEFGGLDGIVLGVVLAGLVPPLAAVGGAELAGPGRGRFGRAFLLALVAQVALIAASLSAESLPVYAVGQVVVIPLVATYGLGSTRSTAPAAPRRVVKASCTGDADCAPGQTCSRGRCTCSRRADCAEGLFCYEGRCLPL